jgi:hypothetical protein
MKNKSANMIQHNGFYSCTYCQHPGESVFKLNGGKGVVYPTYADRCFRLRSNVTYRSAMEELKNNSEQRTKSGR